MKADYDARAPEYDATCGCHLEESDRRRFLREARRVARERVVVDSVLHA